MNALGSYGLEDVTRKFNTEYLRLDRKKRPDLVTLATALASAQLYESESASYGFVERFMNNEDDPLVRSFVETIGHTYEELRTITKTKLTPDELIELGIVYLATEIKP